MFLYSASERGGRERPPPSPSRSLPGAPFVSQRIDEKRWRGGGGKICRAGSFLLPTRSTTVNSSTVVPLDPMHTLFTLPHSRVVTRPYNNQRITSTTRQQPAVSRKTSHTHTRKSRDQPAAHVGGTGRRLAPRSDGADPGAPCRDGSNGHRGTGRALLRAHQAEAALPGAETRQPLRQGGRGSEQVIQNVNDRVFKRIEQVTVQDLFSVCYRCDCYFDREATVSWVPNITCVSCGKGAGVKYRFLRFSQKKICIFLLFVVVVVVARRLRHVQS